MTVRPFAFVYAALVAGLAGAAFASSCVTETNPPGYTGPVGEPGVAIASPVNGSCWEIPEGPNPYVPIQLTLTNFILRPPGGCVNLSNCGQAKLTVNGLDDNVTATPIVDLTFTGDIVFPYGTWNLEVELIDDQGDPWILPADAGIGGGSSTYYGPFKATATITTATSCESGS